MDLLVDHDVRLILETMQRQIPMGRLISVANGVAALAPILWGHYPQDAVVPLSLAEPILIDVRPSPPAASVCDPAKAHADDDSAAAGDD